MSRTHRQQPTSQHRKPQTFNELKQVKVTNDYLDTQYQVSTRNRYIPTAWDDLRPSSYHQNNHH